MEQCLFSVYRRAQFYDGIKLHRLGKAIDREFQLSGNKLGDTEALRIQTSDLLRKALFIAKWAAVREFPNSIARDRKSHNKSVQTTESYFEDTTKGRGKQVVR